MFSIIQAAGWPIWPLLACSVLALALIIERFISLKTNRVVPATLLQGLLGFSRSALPDAQALERLAQASAAGEVFASGLRALRADPACTQEVLRAELQNAGRRVARRLEKYLDALATIASAAPLLGLFGTVVGMIEIFGSQNSVAGGNPAQLAHGISIALYNTAFGLMVAIPSLVFWRYFRARVDGFVLTIELAAEQWLRDLQR